jgi:hypothetical protein
VQPGLRRRHVGDVEPVLKVGPGRPSGSCGGWSGDASLVPRPADLGSVLAAR